MSGRGFNRRDFIYLSTAGLGLGALSLMGGTSRLLAAVNGQSPPDREDGVLKVIDPPAGSLFKDPPEMPALISKDGVVEVELDIRIAPVNIGGAGVKLMAYNGSFPSQTIRVRKGDRLKVRFKNSLPKTAGKNALGHIKNATNLHTHGWHVSPSGNSDNIFIHIQPGEDFLFEYDTSKQAAGTLNHYHPHYHGLVSEQMWNGLSGGCIIVEDDTDVLSGLETHVFILKDISLEGGYPSPYIKEDYIDGKEGDIVMVNGQINPVLSVRPGQVQRWRILNASTARYYKISLEGHTLHLVGTDGGLLDRPYPLTEVLLTPGERVDVLVRADDKAGTYRLLSLPYNRMGKPVTAERITLLTVSCDGKPEKNDLPRSINPDAKRLSVDISGLPRKKLYLIMANGRGFVNLKDFDIEPYVLTSKVGTYEVWEIINISPMDHPFHQHTNPSQIVSITKGDPGYASLYTTTPAWKDTVNVPFAGSVTMVVPVMDFTGKAVFHCHITEHEDTGMMGVWDIVE